MKPFRSLLVLAFLFSSLPTPPPLSAAFNGTLTFDKGHLSASIAATPLDQVLEQFSSISGVPVRWLNGQISTETVSVEFTNLPLLQGLQKILAKQDFMLFYSSPSPHAQLTYIWITTKGDAQSLTSSLPPGQKPEPISSSDDDTLEEDSGSAKLQPDHFLQIALQDNDPAKREKAVGYLEASARRDQRAFDALTRLAQQAPHAEVQELATEALQQFE